MGYDIIYADPPWQYNDKASAGKRGSAYKYNVLKTDAICSLPVYELAAPNAVLFLWVTFPFVETGIQVIRNWGFRYKTIGFVWVKETKRKNGLHWGMGNWTRSNPELCLLGVRGQPKRVQANVHSVIISPVQNHSQKPQEARDRIIQLCGDKRRIELFAREKVPGWDAWGDEIESDVVLNSGWSIPNPTIPPIE